MTPKMRFTLYIMANIVFLKTTAHIQRSISSDQHHGQVRGVQKESHYDELRKWIVATFIFLHGGILNLSCLQSPIWRNPQNDQARRTTACGRVRIRLYVNSRHRFNLGNPKYQVIALRLLKCLRSHRGYRPEPM